jgi:hypothetical protein
MYLIYPDTSKCATLLPLNFFVVFKIFIGFDYNQVSTGNCVEHCAHGAAAIGIGVSQFFCDLGHSIFSFGKDPKPLNLSFASCHTASVARKLKNVLDFLNMLETLSPEMWARYDAIRSDPGYWSKNPAIGVAKRNVQALVLEILREEPATVLGIQNRRPDLHRRSIENCLCKLQRAGLIEPVTTGYRRLYRVK